MKYITLIFVFALSSCLAKERVVYKEASKVPYSILDTLLSRHVSDNGVVDYTGFKDDSTLFNRCVRMFRANHPAENWNRAEQLAYWINAYNVFTIELILKNYPTSSIKNISSPWDQDFIKIRDNVYSLNDIEHEILRKMNEPRIHFAIVCASYSCPILRNEAFRSEKLEAQLDEQTKKFINDSNRNKLSEKKLELSEIFNWFSSDFDSVGGVKAFVMKYSEVSISEKAKILYLDYNWSLNDSCS